MWVVQGEESRNEDEQIGMIWKENGLEGAFTEAVDCNLQHAKCTVHISVLLLAVVWSLAGTIPGCGI